MTDIDLYDDDDWERTWAYGDEPLSEPIDAEVADRYLRLLSRHEQRVNDIEEQFAAEIDRLTVRRDDLLAGPLRQAARYRTALEGWARANREATGKASFDLLHGRIRTRAGRTAVVVDEPEAVIAWHDDNYGDAEDPLPIVEQPAPPPRRVSKQAIADAIKNARLAANGALVVDTETGEVIPGVRLATGDTSVTIEGAS